MRAKVVFEFLHQRMTFERLLNDGALNALAAAVNQSHDAKTGGVSFADVFLDDRRNVARREGMKVQLRFDENAVRLVVYHCSRITARGAPPPLARRFTPSPCPSTGLGTTLSLSKDRSGRGRSHTPR
jgi:hypothetical protein